MTMVPVSLAWGRQGDTVERLGCPRSGAGGSEIGGRWCGTGWGYRGHNLISDKPPPPESAAPGEQRERRNRPGPAPWTGSGG